MSSKPGDGLAANNVPKGKGKQIESGNRAKTRSKTSVIAAFIVDNKYVVGFTTILTIIALTGEDLRMLTTTVEFDFYYDWIVAFMFLVFGLECFLSCLGKDDYFLGFFFWLDLVSTLTLLLDISVVMPFLIDLFTPDGGEGSAEGGDQGEQARAGRSAKIGAKAGRVVRVLRLVRILKLYKAYYEAKMRKKMKEERAKRGEVVEDDWDDEDFENTGEDPMEGGSESRVGKKLSETTTRRVICLILAMLLTLPLLQVEMQPATSAEYGADYVLRIFLYYKQGRVNKTDYQNAMLQYIFYHNWFAKDEQFCPNPNCANQYYGNLFWVGIQGKNETAVIENAELARLDYDVIKSFNDNAKDQDDIYNYGTMPLQALRSISNPWDTLADDNCQESLRKVDIEDTRRGISLLDKEIPDVVSRTIPCPSYLRSSEFAGYYPRSLTSTEHKQWNFRFYFDLTRYKKEEAMFSIFTTAFVLMLLVLGSMMFSNDAKRLVINPVEKMIKRVEAIRENPLIAIKMADEEFKAEEIAKAKTARQNKERASALIQDLISCQICSAKSGNEPMETVILEKTIIKLGSLLALGFGEAGANIIGHNMSGSDTAGVNAMIPGTHVDCVIGVARVRDFSTATEVLQAKIMTFVNQIAEIVHGVVNDFHGAPNKNNGDAFLIIWRLDGNLSKSDSPQASEKDTCRLAEMSVAAFAMILGALHRSPLLASYRGHPGLQNRLGTNCRVNLSFGLHLGWAIEGAVGSEFKIDASYLSPNVSIATSVERATEVYSVSLLVAQSLIEKCSKNLVIKCRLIDQVIIKGSARSMGLYCLDLDYRSVQVADDEKPLTIVWNTRNRFKARQFLESEKNSKLADDFNVAELFDTDPTLVCMRMRYTVEFFQLFNMGFQNYYEGEWQVARRMLSCTRAILGVEDGPSNALLRFMEIPYGFEAPKGWKGVREVDTKQAGSN